VVISNVSLGRAPRSCGADLKPHSNDRSRNTPVICNATQETIKIYIDGNLARVAEFISQPHECLSELITPFPIRPHTPKGIAIGILHRVESACAGVQQFYSRHLNQFRIASGEELSLQVWVLRKFEEQYFIHLQYTEKLASGLEAYVRTLLMLIRFQSERTCIW
jgi:hypothetical protein